MNGSSVPRRRGVRLAVTAVTVLTMTTAAVSCSQTAPARSSATTAGSDVVTDPATPPDSAPSTTASTAPSASAPASVTATSPVDTDGSPGSVLAGLPADAPATTAGIEDTLASAVGSRGLGSSWGLVILDPRTGALLAARRTTQAFLPASTTKILTAAAVLARYGGAHRFTTRVELAGTTGGVARLVLVGGGDPSLTAAEDGDDLSGDAADDPVADPARLSALVSATAGALQTDGTTRATVTVDDSLFAGPAVSPQWRASYVAGGFVGPVDALSLDGGRTRPSTIVRSADPGLAAGEVFAEELRDAGITVAGSPGRGAAPSTGGPVIGAVTSPPLVALLRHMLLASDNDYAETLARDVAAGTATPASFTGSAAAVLSQLSALGVDTSGTRLVDGSGLSRADAIPPLVLARVLAATLRSPALAGVPRGLPVAGRSGTLTDRFTGAARAGDGLVFAKTGTLTGVDNLAGYVRTASAGPLVVVLMADRTASEATAEPAIDLLVARLVHCGCHG